MRRAPTPSAQAVTRARGLLPAQASRQALSFSSTTCVCQRISEPMRTIEQWRWMRLRGSRPRHRANDRLCNMAMRSLPRMPRCIGQNRELVLLVLLRTRVLVQATNLAARRFEACGLPVKARSSSCHRAACWAANKPGRSVGSPRTKSVTRARSRHLFQIGGPPRPASRERCRVARRP